MVRETQRILEIEQRHGSGVYKQRELALLRGQGAQVWDQEGRAYIDCAAGHGVANLGHGHPAILAAIREQSERLITCPESYPNQVRARLLERLTSVLPGGLSRVFLANSGTEAVEAALKFARLSSGRTGIIAAMRGFHGRSMGALSATWEKRYREPFMPLVPGFGHAPFGRLEAFERLVGPDTAAILIECVQGEGGVRPGTADFLQGLQRLCAERDVLLIVDEIQTGFGRTGKLFACEHFGLEPDLITLGKALGGGLPMGAVAFGPRVVELPVGAHGSTFGGNPLACAAALASLEVFRSEPIVERAAELGRWLFDELAALESPLVREIRGMGLMVGIELKLRVLPVLQGLLERGVLALPAGPNVLRLLPPLVIQRAQLEQVVEALGDTLAQVQAEAGTQKA